MSATKETKKKHKRRYKYITKEDILAGEDWKINLPIDQDVALKIIEERDNNPGGGEVIKILNSRLRSAYRIKAKK